MADAVFLWSQRATARRALPMRDVRNHAGVSASMSGLDCENFFGTHRHTFGAFDAALRVKGKILTFQRQGASRADLYTYGARSTRACHGDGG